MAAVERDYWINPDEADRKGFWIFGHLLLFTVGALIVAFLVWADFAVLDEVTRGQGKVISSSQVQVIQNLEGGIMSEILVREGDVVEKDQVIIKIDNTLAQSNLNELQQRRWLSLAAVARLEVEVSGKTPDQIVYSPELLAEQPTLADNEMSSAKVRHDQLQSQLAVLRDQVTQREQEVIEIDSKAKNLKTSLGLAAEELRIMKPLVASNVVSKVEYLQKQREVNDLQSELDATNQARPRAKSALQEAANRVIERESTFRSEASTELGKYRTELAGLNAQLSANQDRVTRTEVRSPMRGIVKEIKIRTIGGVIQPGEDLVEIVPIEDSLLVEAQVRPADRGFIDVGQPAVVKIDTYDFSIYGGLDGEVEFISPDALEEEVAGRREKFFRVRVRTDRNFLGTADNPLTIRPGYTGTVDILTGKKTVLEYLLKPILKARDTALRER
ncbi:MAG: HlyD family type I secretion periplasmic adaptor subunit [Dongiaceae bacterium]